MIDFNKLSRPTAKNKPLDPLEIFAKTPNVKDAPNDLWKGQADALRVWHDRRKTEDNVILLNTGAGKSIVGILIAQSLINEDIGPIVYCCSTIDLVKQTAKECDKLGIKYSTRTHSKFSNDLFETKQAFCITTYQSLFSPINVFGTTNSPAAVIFDDAHVAERIIRDSFSLTVSKSTHPTLFEELVRIVRPEFDKIDRNAHLSYVLEGVGQQRVTMCPPATAHSHREEIIAALKKAQYSKDASLHFPTIRLYQNIGNCAILVSPNFIEIAPPFIPAGIFSFLKNGVRRVYLSATLDYDTDFIRGFGRRISVPIAPDNDAGNGERLILLAGGFNKEPDKNAVATRLLRAAKLLISVPSYQSAKSWETIAKAPPVEEFSASLEAFRQSTKGAFLLVSRIDGIDLPQDTCRIMLIDGAPSGASLIEQYLFSQLSLSNIYSTKMAGRITQLLGRINRGRSDYGAFVIYGRDINNWLKTERNLALLPQLIRKQFILGRSVQEDMGDKSTPNDIADVIAQIISRDKGWLEFYRETIDGLEISNDIISEVKEREYQLSQSAIAECDFMTRLWQSDVEGARKTLLDVLDDTAVADAKLAGWYSLWIGMTYEAAGDMDTALAHYRKARARLSTWLNVKFTDDGHPKKASEEALTAFQTSLLTANKHGPQALGDLSGKLKARIKHLTDEDKSFKVQEESLRYVGELLGFQATRPDNESGVGPDVIWLDNIEKYGIAFELKTKKDSKSQYNKSEIGQALNHLQWISDEFPDVKFDGLIIIGPKGACTNEASPSDDIYLTRPEEMCDRILEISAKIDDIRGKTQLERYTLYSSLGQLSEWSLRGWFASLATQRLKDL